MQDFNLKLVPNCCSVLLLTKRDIAQKKVEERGGRETFTFLGNREADLSLSNHSKKKKKKEPVGVEKELRGGEEEGVQKPPKGGGGEGEGRESNEGCNGNCIKKEGGTNCCLV